MVVTNNDRLVGVFLSMEDLEDTIWAERALAAHKEGYLSAEESCRLIDSLRHAED